MNQFISFIRTLHLVDTKWLVLFSFGSFLFALLLAHLGIAAAAPITMLSGFVLAQALFKIAFGNVFRK